jgi:uncharacterized protein YjbJ (UPF0337 family)
MNWEQVKGNWKQVKGKVKQQWGKLTDDQLDVISGNRDILLGRIQEAYGITTEEAERQVRDWEGRQDGSYESDDEDRLAREPIKRKA